MGPRGQFGNTSRQAGFEEDEICESWSAIGNQGGTRVVIIRESIALRDFWVKYRGWSWNFYGEYWGIKLGEDLFMMRKLIDFWRIRKH